MWIASWNAKGYTPLYSKKETKQKNDANEANQADYDAYYVGTSENPTAYSANISSNNKEYEDTLYFPHPRVNDSFASTNNCYSYWLTSPSASNAYYGVMMVSDVRGLYDGLFNHTGVGVRPVVCLPSSILGEQDGTGKWVLK